MKRPINRALDAAIDWCRNGFEQDDLVDDGDREMRDDLKAVADWLEMQRDKSAQSPKYQAAKKALTEAGYEPTKKNVNIVLKAMHWKEKQS